VACEKFNGKHGEKDGRGATMASSGDTQYSSREGDRRTDTGPASSRRERKKVEYLKNSSQQPTRLKREGG